ncbi:FecR domain-containing protein [Candidatus Absconditicoccus praedator]|uniref:FecR domain-containing protein n=1 Tax=Candidatus Absconditicoccus praedator TaxID=2735562 RepID=UPI001E4790CE|nr:FecR domain-containing protein [Candidatus Absconditicoccus praedator]UFX82526.1 FecR domain-containing protein [Candidatus Absconditicoccus praedator]
MNKILKSKRFSLVALICTFILFLFIIFDIGMGFAISLIISAIIVFLLSKTKSIIGMIIIFFIILFNIVYLTFSLTPTYSQEVSLEDYYKGKENIVSFNIMDTKETLEDNNASLRVRSPKGDERINLYKEGIEDKQVSVGEDDVISFMSRTNEISTTINIRFRDGSSIRLFPQSTIKMSEIYQDQENLLDSRTNLKVENGSVRFNVIRTITGDEGFNVETDSGTLVIRGTSGFIEHDINENETSAYSHDHLIEVVNKAGESMLLGNGEAAAFSEDFLERIDIYEFIDNVGEDIYKRLNRFFQEDMQNIEQYQEDIVNYIKENYSWSLDDSNFFERISYWKMRIGSFFDETKKSNLENYRNYKALLGDEDINVGDIREENILVPVNDTIDNIRLRFLREAGEEDEDTMRSYIINRYNEALEAGEDIDTDEIYNQIKSSDTIQNIIDGLDNF